MAAPMQNGFTQVNKSEKINLSDEVSVNTTVAQVKTSKPSGQLRNLNTNQLAI